MQVPKFTLAGRVCDLPEPLTGNGVLTIGMLRSAAAPRFSPESTYVVWSTTPKKHPALGARGPAPGPRAPLFGQPATFAPFGFVAISQKNSTPKDRCAAHFLVAMILRSRLHSFNHPARSRRRLLALRDSGLLSSYFHRHLPGCSMQIPNRPGDRTSCRYRCLAR
jgi:hypothetical protein